MLDVIVIILNGENKTDLEAYAKIVRKDNEEMAKEALRVYSCAYKEIDINQPDEAQVKNIENDVNICWSLVGMIDPPKSKKLKKQLTNVKQQE